MVAIFVSHSHWLLSEYGTPLILYIYIPIFILKSKSKNVDSHYAVKHDFSGRVQGSSGSADRCNSTFWAYMWGVINSGRCKSPAQREKMGVFGRPKAIFHDENHARQVGWPPLKEIVL